MPTLDQVIPIWLEAEHHASPFNGQANRSEMLKQFALVCACVYVHMQCVCVFGYMCHTNVYVHVCLSSGGMCLCICVCQGGQLV